MKQLKERDLKTIVEIVKSSDIPLTAGNITRKLYEINYSEEQNDAILIQKKILKSFTHALSNKLKEFNVFRKRRNVQQQFIYYHMSF